MTAPGLPGRKMSNAGMWCSSCKAKYTNLVWIDAEETWKCWDCWQADRGKMGT